MSYLENSKPVTLAELARMRAAGEKIAMLTAYDASFAALCERNGVDVLLVGDSLGNVVQGQKSTLPVTMEHMVYHTECVARGTQRAWVITDLPFGSYQENPAQALRNAVRLMAAGAQMVKLEGGAYIAETVRFLVERGVPVCAHIGLTPQSVHQLGGYRVQGRGEAAAAQLKADALTLETAGATMVVMEMVPAQLGADITRSLKQMATIGIGAGKDCDGQVLVLHDMLGVYPGKKARFVKNFMEGAANVDAAVAAYAAAVKNGSFPAPEHTY
ncbi:MAG: 3-methyl-2-oxobutanoate hydroxymethyltransferase [Candidatus Dactylopiibacterium carminicum]|uniref:3-methyl-2-oxobutanoate hydroxymethyltransferase n=1 Tax=Candidatus Dactylopiibacterium carminicum TaxID=857335 RepID=A0A272ENH1_9RHOO|nr:3-methyl-2-oxobutanoate hydroxymethyltransferase [Candidatus Dactylopiibacterium carminicum]KAF7599295.1 3-methyl-2-oxobutanoate hydroxymethyltransferase [Candidatus Dactylopiibacterium carminicum]PAS91663.1 MAG: 3-methyl-2-oxobutanoate hydroxymethyltransferase [Candidatus Dactylopiibacterium carminicum]PAS97189.1 MAG: 3-methyl-2-oxobutanoate hydroxymethyltransferase [Candidatus Dactylopiibacterium carminicum]PAS99298.1 MAG: 3-methyl-2-oxobutanoate hydroxymethyltransferase [Candidatus Dactyl